MTSPVYDKTVHEPLEFRAYVAKLSTYRRWHLTSYNWLVRCAGPSGLFSATGTGRWTSATGTGRWPSQPGTGPSRTGDLAWRHGSPPAATSAHSSVTGRPPTAGPLLRRAGLWTVRSAPAGDDPARHQPSFDTPSLPDNPVRRRPSVDSPSVRPSVKRAVAGPGLCPCRCSRRPNHFRRSD